VLRLSTWEFRRYQDLVAWQLARELERGVVAFTATSPASKDFDYCHQIRNSSLQDRGIWLKGLAVLPGRIRALTRNALGSLRETQDHLGAGLERGYLSESLHTELFTLADRAIVPR